MVCRKEHLGTGLDGVCRPVKTDDYGISGYKAGPARIEELYARIVRDRIGRLSAEALACKSLISRYGPVITEVPYEP